MVSLTTDINATSEYNDRLFSKGFRRRIHLARFYWLRDTILTLKGNMENVIELGCFDAKSIEFLPLRPTRYVGIDANWEGGLDLARNKWPDYQFIESMNPEGINVDGPFDLGISQETFEHIEPDLVPAYLEKMASLIDGYMLITVPNETGPLFFTKHLAKMLMRSTTSDYSYTFKEFLHQSLGMTDKVERVNGSHKGFNYKQLVTEVDKHFNIVDVQAIPFVHLPKFLGFNIGIIGKSK